MPSPFVSSWPGPQKLDAIEHLGLFRDSWDKNVVYIAHTKSCIEGTIVLNHSLSFAQGEWMKWKTFVEQFFVTAKRFLNHKVSFAKDLPRKA